MLGKIKSRGGSIEWRGDRNGEDTLFIIPDNGELEVVDTEKEDTVGEIYICQITVDGVKYTNVKIPKFFTNKEVGWFNFIPANLTGGKSRNRKSHRRRRTSRRHRRTAK